MRTNTYATVCNNVFDHVRRRSPRSSGLTVVHAFNNVLLDWGAGVDDEQNDSTPQQNGMEVGNAGIMVAAANYFKAGKLKETIKVASDEPAPRLTVPGGVLQANKYEGDALPTPSIGQRIAIDRKYREALGENAVVPQPEVISDALRTTIEGNAGPKDQAPHACVRVRPIEAPGACEGGRGYSFTAPMASSRKTMAPRAVVHSAHSL